MIGEASYSQLSQKLVTLQEKIFISENLKRNTQNDWLWSRGQQIFSTFDLICIIDYWLSQELLTIFKGKVEKWLTFRSSRQKFCFFWILVDWVRNYSEFSSENWKNDWLSMTRQKAFLVDWVRNYFECSRKCKKMTEVKNYFEFWRKK